MFVPSIFGWQLWLLCSTELNLKSKCSLIVACFWVAIMVGSFVVPVSPNLEKEKEKKTRKERNNESTRRLDRCCCSKMHRR